MIYVMKMYTGDCVVYLTRARYSSFFRFFICTLHPQLLFLVRSQISMGKYCSSNAHGGPFTIYSVDGYAKVRFSSNASEVDIGYRFSFELKPFATTLGSNTDTTCM